MLFAEIWKRLMFLMLVVMAFLMAAGALMRYLFNSPIAFADEVSGLMLLGITFLGLAYVEKDNAHIRIEMLFRRVKPGMRRPSWPKSTGSSRCSGCSSSSSASPWPLWTSMIRGKVHVHGMADLALCLRHDPGDGHAAHRAGVRKAQSLRLFSIRRVAQGDSSKEVAK